MYNNDRVTRRYSEPFKLKILPQLITGKYTKSQLGKCYSIAPTICLRGLADHAIQIPYSIDKTSAKMC
jgi:hypothetical protein